MNSQFSTKTSCSAQNWQAAASKLFLLTIVLFDHELIVELELPFETQVYNQVARARFCKLRT